MTVVSGSLTTDLTPIWQDRLGFAPSDLFTFHWHGILTSALVTSGGLTFWLAFALMIVLLLVSEKISGTYRTGLAFWLSHLVATIGGALLVWVTVQVSSSSLLNEIYTARDVGPSAGYFGCMGLIVAHFPRPWKYLVGFAIIAALVGGMIVSALNGATIDVASGLAHLIAFPIGWEIGSEPFLKRSRI